MGIPIPPIRYLLDSNIFIESNRTFYALDIAPSFWNKLIELSNENRILSIDKVFDELKRGKDDLFDWVVENLPKTFFKSTLDSDELFAHYQSLIHWCNKSNQYNQNGKE